MDWRFLFVAAIAATASAAAEPRGPRLLNVQDLVTWEDYPSVSLERGQEGQVVVRVNVGPDGLVTSCKIARSSGHAPLDEQTCSLFRARARFEPARNRRGQPIASDYEQKIAWKIEHDSEAPLPRQAWSIRSTLSIDQQGQILDCTMEAVGLSAVPQDCELLLKALPEDAKPPASSTGAIAFTITDSYFFPVEPATVTIPPDIAGAENLAQQISEVLIAPDGRVTDCTGIRYSGLAGPETDACSLLRHLRFVPVGPHAPTLKGTVVMTVYLRTQSIT